MPIQRLSAGGAGGAISGGGVTGRGTERVSGRRCNCPCH
ncbi:hypothetical protein C789_2864 [Microcystis aeruginosa FACHB-905 = DIANCHI905]|nr:hypothetical protein C789_2864 [Microcystis aeruginosa FACHB-905 = DIANCHI905]